MQSKGLSRVFSNTTDQKHQFFSTQLSSQSNSHIHAQVSSHAGLTFVQDGVGGTHLDNQSPRVPRCARLSRNGRSACNLITAGLLRSQSANPQQSPARSRVNVGSLHLGGRRPVHTFPSAGAAARSPEGAGCARTRASGRQASPFLTENAKGGQRRQAGVHAAGGDLIPGPVLLHNAKTLLLPPHIS